MSAKDYLGEVLRRARKRAGLTQQEAARAAHFAHASTIANWENGWRSPTLRALRTYAQALGTTATAIVREWEEEARP